MVLPQGLLVCQTLQIMFGDRHAVRDVAAAARRLRAVLPDRPGGRHRVHDALQDGGLSARRGGGRGAAARPQQAHRGLRARLHGAGQRGQRLHHPESVLRDGPRRQLRHHGLVAPVLLPLVLQRRRQRPGGRQLPGPLPGAPVRGRRRPRHHARRGLQPGRRGGRRDRAGAAAALPPGPHHRIGPGLPAVPLDAARRPPQRGRRPVRGRDPHGRRWPRRASRHRPRRLLPQRRQAAAAWVLAQGAARNGALPARVPDVQPHSGLGVLRRVGAAARGLRGAAVRIAEGLPVRPVRAGPPASQLPTSQPDRRRRHGAGRPEELPRLVLPRDQRPVPVREGAEHPQRGEPRRPRVERLWICASATPAHARSTGRLSSGALSRSLYSAHSDKAFVPPLYCYFPTTRYE